MITDKKQLEYIINKYFKDKIINNFNTVQDKADVTGCTQALDLDLARECEKANKEILHAFPDYQVAIDSMCKVDIYPQPILERLRNFLVSGIIDLVHKIEHKYAIDSIKMYQDNHLTCKFMPRGKGVDVLTRIQGLLHEKGVKVDRNFDNNLTVYIGDKQALDVTIEGGRLKLILGDDSNYMSGFMATELVDQKTTDDIIAIMQIVKPYLKKTRYKL